MNKKTKFGLSLALATQLCSSVSATEPLGTIETNLIFDNLDSKISIERRNIEISLLKSENGTEAVLGKTSLSGTGTKIGGFPLNVVENQGIYQITVGNLPLGQYKIAITGVNHVDFLSDSLDLTNTNKQLNITTSSSDFTYGDVNGDNQVNSLDLYQLEAEIRENNHKNDLTGDGKVDISDLALIQLI